MIYKIDDFYKKHKNSLKLKLFAGEKGLNKKIKKTEVHSPGLSLTGNIKNYKPYRILVIGETEIQYLKELDPKNRLIRLNEILTQDTPAVIVSRKLNPLKEIKAVCEKKSISLFKSDIETIELISKIIIALKDDFSLKTNVHGTLVEVFGKGVLIQGESSTGKSETALALLGKGHSLISDDIVKIRKKDENYLIGSGPKLTRYLMEIRDIGVINVANLYGALSVKEDIVIDIVIELDPIDLSRFENKDRLGIKQKFKDILGVKIPFYQLHINPQRDVALLIETLTLNQRLKESGYNSAKEFKIKLIQKIAKRKKNTSEIS